MQLQANCTKRKNDESDERNRREYSDTDTQTPRTYKQTHPHKQYTRNNLVHRARSVSMSLTYTHLFTKRIRFNIYNRETVEQKQKKSSKASEKWCTVELKI